MPYRACHVLFILTLLLSACASPPPPAPDWSYEKEAIEMRVKADPQLNLDDGAPHTLVLCTYQLRDPNTFNLLAEDLEGIYKLLACDLFDHSVATAKRFIVHPGEETVHAMDRAAGARHVGVVAGYYTLHQDRVTRLYNIPVSVETSGLVRRTTVSRPGRLSFELELGPLQIGP